METTQGGNFSRILMHDMEQRYGMYYSVIIIIIVLMSLMNYLVLIELHILIKIIKKRQNVDYI